MGDKRREGLVLFLFNIFRVYQLELLEITLILEITQPTSADISSQRLVHPAADEDFCYMLKRTCGQVLVLPS